jgi:glucose-6-phosphate-specific signal transduction histidine kinase
MAARLGSESGKGNRGYRRWRTPGLTLEVTDDGAGFDPRTVRSGLGMAGMRERLATVGGTISFTSAPGAGTTLNASIPMHYDRRRRMGSSP